MDVEKVSDSLAAGIKATGGQGEERSKGEERGEERDSPSDPGGPASVAPSPDRDGGVGALTPERLATIKESLGYPSMRQTPWHRGIIEELVAGVDSLSAQLSACLAERDALMNLVVQPWARDGDGAQLWKVNLAGWRTITSREEGMAMVRTAAGLDPDPKADSTSTGERHE
jgi:hypothetical protein